MVNCPLKQLFFGSAYENTSYTVCIFTQTTHNSQTIFKINYNPPFTLCQQFRLFYHLGKVIFVAMHTIANPFLYILSTAQIFAILRLLMKY